MGNNGVPTAADDVVFVPQNNTFSIVDPGFQAGAGTVASLTINPGHTAQINLQENLTVQSTFQSDGSIFGSPSFIVPTGGVYNWYNGTLKGFGSLSTATYQTVIQNGATMNIAPNNPTLTLQLNGRTIQNNGTINWNTANSNISITNGGLLNNFGLLNVPINGAFNVQGDSSSAVYNQGTVQLSNGGPSLDFQVPFTNNPQGELSLLGVASTVQWHAPATLNDGTLVSGPGQTQIYSMLTVNGIVTNEAVMWGNLGSAILSTGRLEVTGSLNVIGDALQGEIHIATGASFNILGDVTIQGSVIIDGTGTWSAGNITFQNAGKINTNPGSGFTINAQFNARIAGNGAFNNGGFTTIDVGANNSINVTSGFTNTSSLVLRSGSLIFPQNWTQDEGGFVTFGGGDLRVNGNFTVNGFVNGISGNDATIYATLVTNNGVISFVGSNTQTFLRINPYPGMMMGGNYTQTSAALLRLKVLAPAFCDQLQIAGTATLSGTLDIVLAGGYQPAGQNPLTWTPLLYNGQNNGQFTTVNRPPNFALPNYFVGGMTITWNP